jgi:hypothetical protein
MSKPHDIEAVISGVQSQLPAVAVVQMHQTHPADDDGLWWFRLPGVSRDIQLESSTHDCPFLVEHSDRASTSEALTAHSVPEAVSFVVSYLRSISSAA